MSELTNSQKFWPFRLAIILLYSTPKWAQRYGSLVIVSLPEMRKALGIDKKRLRGYFEEMERLSLVHGLKTESGIVQFKVQTPRGYEIKEK